MTMSPTLETLLALPDHQLADLLGDFTEEQAQEFLYDWSVWARPNQMAPEGAWATWLVNAGRGFGKTRIGSEWIRSQVCGTTPLAPGKCRRVALIAETAADARDVMMEGESGLLNVHPRDFRPLYEPSKRKVTWPNGAIAHIYNATEPDQLRGPQHDAFWGDELAKWAYARETWDQIQFGLRLGKNPRGVVTTTPRPTPLYVEIMQDPTTVVTNGRTMDNAANLSKKFLEKVHSRYSGTRLGRQELEAEVLLDLPGALWTRSMFDPPDGSGHPGRIRFDLCPPFSRVVVAVDPSGTRQASDDGDSIGIVVAGIDDTPSPKGPVGYVLADCTVRGGPSEWGRAAVKAYHHFQADRLVAEINYGGAMVESVIRSVDPNVSYREVKASRGKVIRAEPISALYEQGRVRHVVGGNPWDDENEGLGPLEDQLCQMAPSGFNGTGSPDRADALVWALTDLMLVDEEGYTLSDLRRAL